MYAKPGQFKSKKGREMVSIAKTPLSKAEAIEVNQGEEFLTAEDLARFFHISARTVYNWTVDKKIPYYKIGGLIRFKRSDLEGWVEKGKRSEHLKSLLDHQRDVRKSKGRQDGRN